MYAARAREGLWLLRQWEAAGDAGDGNLLGEAPVDDVFASFAPPLPAWWSDGPSATGASARPRTSASSRRASGRSRAPLPRPGRWAANKTGCRVENKLLDLKQNRDEQDALAKRVKAGKQSTRRRSSSRSGSRRGSKSGILRPLSRGSDGGAPMLVSMSAGESTISVGSQPELVDSSADIGRSSPPGSEVFDEAGRPFENEDDFESRNMELDVLRKRRPDTAEAHYRQRGREFNEKRSLVLARRAKNQQDEMQRFVAARDRHELKRAQEAAARRAARQRQHEAGVLTAVCAAAAVETWFELCNEWSRDATVSEGLASTIPK